MMYLFVILLIIVLGLLVYGVININKIKDNIQCDYEHVSFYNEFARTYLPLIDFYIKDTYCTFIVDTGANSNLIREDFVKEIYPDYKLNTELDNDIMTLTGTVSKNETLKMNLYKNGKFFCDKFLLTENYEPFDYIAQDIGRNIVGIIGSKFMDNYNFTINFKKKSIIYKK